ncbi:MAG: hypothetical protein EA357_10575 [Micavibrio sp.]|nr:MAG: hypothetical protein EA357_10575 [Micavibrio sp.]
MTDFERDAGLADMRESLRRYIRDQVVTPLETDQTVKNGVVQDLRIRAQAVGETGRQIASLNGAMEDVSRRGIKNLTDGLFSLSRNASAARRELNRELSSLTRELLQNIMRQIRSADFSHTVPQQSGSSGGLVSGLWDFAGGLLGFRAGGGSVTPGQAFVVGERGPELLVTGRTAGSVLPHQGTASPSAAAPVSVTVVNNAVADISVREKTGGSGGRELEIMVDLLVAKSLSRSGSKSFQALESTYGLRPVLNGR